MLMSVTIKDVAKAANVSVATVSRVLNKKSNVSEEAIQAVKTVLFRHSDTAPAFSAEI